VKVEKLASVYKPSRWGEIYHNIEGVDELLGAGSAGPGKSFVLLMDPIYQIVGEVERQRNPSHPFYLGNRPSRGNALHLRRTKTMLDQTLSRAREIFPIIDPGVKFSASPNMVFVFSCGYRYQFDHCRDPDDWAKYQSNEYCHIGFDELVQFTENQFDQITTRCRSSDPWLRKQLKIRAMSNPMMMWDDSSESFTQNDPLWVRKRFVDNAPAGNVLFKRELRRADGTTAGFKTWMYLPAKLHDNPDQGFVEAYERQLLGQKPHIRKALLEGDWYVTANSYYADVWVPSIHVIDPFKIPSTWRRFRSMDWGFKCPGTVLWWALDEDGNMYCVHELTFKEKTTVDVAGLIKSVEDGMGLWRGKRSILTGPADTQLWEERGGTGQTKAQEFAASGVHWAPADKTRRHRNAELLVKRLQDHDAGTKAPGIAFFKKCVNTVRTLPAIPADPGDPNVPRDGGEDHWHDAVLYACAYASRAGRGVRPEDLDEEGETKSRSSGPSRGVYGYGEQV